MNHQTLMETIDSSISDGVNRGVLHLIHEGTLNKDGTVRINNNNLVNFTSCSYLGLEHDDRLKSSAITAINMVFNFQNLELMFL